MSIEDKVREFWKYTPGRFFSFYDYKLGKIDEVYKNLLFKGLVFNDANFVDSERDGERELKQQVKQKYYQIWSKNVREDLVLKLRDKNLGLEGFRKVIFELGFWFADEVFRDYFSYKEREVQTFSGDKIMDYMPKIKNNAYFVTVLRAALLPSLAGGVVYNEIAGKELSDFILTDMKRIETKEDYGNTVVNIKNNHVIGYEENDKSVVKDGFILPKSLESVIKRMQDKKIQREEFQKNGSIESRPKFIFYDPMLATMKTLYTTVTKLKNTLSREYNYTVQNSDILVIGLFGVNPLSTDSQSKQIYDKTGKSDDIGLGMFLKSDELRGVKVYTLTLDEHLNEIFYIIPGLGDAGDRCFGDEKNIINISRMLSNDKYLSPYDNMLSHFFRFVSTTTKF